MLKNINGMLCDIGCGESERNWQDVVSHIRNYFAENLPQYDPVKVIRKSVHPDDAYLFMVVARKKDDTSYAVWTSWNEQLQSLNYGHYDLPDLNACSRIMDEFYNGLE